MAEAERLWPGGPVFRQAAHFRLGTDCVLLADFVRAEKYHRGVDLGCASGALMLLLLCRTQRLSMTGLEIVPEAAELARENMEANGLTARAELLCGDIRRHRALFQAGCFDLVVANPPYYPLGAGALPADAARAGARGETSCTLSELLEAAAFLCRTGGSVNLVYKPERLAELLTAMTARGIEPKRLRLACRDPAAAPSLVLVEGRRGGKPGLQIEPALYLKEPDGSDTDELRRISHQNVQR